MMKKKEGRGEKRTGKCMETSLFAINMKRGSLDKPKTGLCVRNDDDEVFFVVMNLMGASTLPNAHDGDLNEVRKRAAI